MADDSDELIDGWTFHELVQGEQDGEELMLGLTGRRGNNGDYTM